LIPVAICTERLKGIKKIKKVEEKLPNGKTNKKIKYFIW